jgi:hypothetical protein
MEQKMIRVGPGGGGEAPTGGGADKLKKAKKDMGELLKAGDAAIKKALSGNSQEFLAANRQMGGE